MSAARTQTTQTRRAQRKRSRQEQRVLPSTFTLPTRDHDRDDTNHQQQNTNQDDSHNQRQQGGTTGGADMDMAAAVVKREIGVKKKAPSANSDEALREIVRQLREVRKGGGIASQNRRNKAGKTALSTRDSVRDRLRKFTSKQLNAVLVENGQYEVHARRKDDVVDSFIDDLKLFPSERSQIMQDIFGDAGPPVTAQEEDVFGLGGRGRKGGDDSGGVVRKPGQILWRADLQQQDQHQQRIRGPQSGVSAGDSFGNDGYWSSGGDSDEPPRRRGVPAQQRRAKQSALEKALEKRRRRESVGGSGSIGGAGRVNSRRGYEEEDEEKFEGEGGKGHKRRFPASPSPTLSSDSSSSDSDDPLNVLLRDPEKRRHDHSPKEAADRSRSPGFGGDRRKDRRAENPRERPAAERPVTTTYVSAGTAAGTLSTKATGKYGSGVPARNGGGASAPRHRHRTLYEPAADPLGYEALSSPDTSDEELPFRRTPSKKRGSSQQTPSQGWLVGGSQRAPATEDGFDRAYGEEEEEDDDSESVTGEEEFQASRRRKRRRV